MSDEHSIGVSLQKAHALIGIGFSTGNGNKPEIEFPDSILPTQLFPKNFKWSSERKLIFAMLEDAVHWFEKFKAPNFLSFGRRERRITNETRDWFFSEDIAWGSFLFICDHLDLDPEYLRRGLTALYEQAQQQWITLSDIEPNTATRGPKRTFRALATGRKTIIS